MMQHTNANGALKYRPDVDGLRAVAVLAVILYHAWPKRFVSGFIGVDVFFVISGYLISSIIIFQLERGKFSIFDFYSRRIRRIFPALLVVLLATIGFAWIIFLHSEFKQLSRHVAAGSAFVSNLVFWNEFGYFDNLGITKPLLHLWSLGVEEQFYIFWPLILWIVFAWRFSFLYLTAIIFCLSMAANVITVHFDPTAAFYSPLTRFWELMSGGVAAYMHQHARTWTPHAKEAASWSGAALLAIGFALIKPQNSFPGWWGLLPVTGTFLLIMAGPFASLNRRVLSHNIAVNLGLISYPLYLWHWPLLSFAYILFGESPKYLGKFALVLAAFVLAFLTYHYVELPLRAIRRRRQLIGALSAGMACVAILGVLANANIIRERISTSGADIYLNALNDRDFPGPAFTPLRYDGIVFQKVSSLGPGLTVFLGDSVVEQYGPYIEHAIATQSTKLHSVIFATVAGCPPIRDVIRLTLMQFPRCRQTADAAYELAGSPEVDTVVIGASWYVYFTDPTQNVWFDNGSLHLAFPGTEATELAYESMRQSLSLLRKIGKRVFLILPPPMGPEFDPRNMYTGSRFGDIRPLAKIENLDLGKFLQSNANPRGRLIKIANEAGAIIIEPSDFLCKQNVCPVLDQDGRPVYTDGIHMRPEYSRRAAVYLEQTISGMVH